MTTAGLVLYKTPKSQIEALLSSVLPSCAEKLIIVDNSPLLKKVVLMNDGTLATELEFMAFHEHGGEFFSGMFDKHACVTPLFLLLNGNV